MNFRFALLAASALGALTASAAHAQTTAAPEAGVEEVVVTGTRTAGRSRLETVAPVDVITTQALARQGSGGELAQALANLTPSISFARPAITDGSDHVRPATLRGLAPDQTLVLINGMRGHVGALVNVNGSIGRGSTAFDLNTIPSVALDRVEVLRDGASAQYGADAIAGVINLRLREANHGGGVSITAGQYDTEFKLPRGTHNETDGAAVTVAGWQGYSLGQDGFLTVSAEYYKRRPTNRSDFINAAALPLLPANTVLGRFGDPDLKSGALYANAGYKLTDTWSLWGYAGGQHRDSESAATPRPYNDARNIAAIYPLGFTPRIQANIDDYNVGGGIKGEVAGFATNLGVTYGKNSLDYTIANTLNVTLGANSPRQFEAGGLEYDQTLVNLNMSRPYDVGLAGPLNVAFGAEYRRESFSVHSGELGSYQAGPFPGAPGSQGFPGFRPSNAVSVDRHNESLYLDLESEVLAGLTLDGAVRYENYSDFGDQVTGKLAGRYDFTPAFGVRAAASTGVKAPALQQQFFSYTSTNNIVTANGSILQEAGTFPVTAPIAISLGAKPLEAEKSTNYSVGFVFHQGPFELTVDGYQIKIRDRIVYSENLPGPTTPAATSAILTARLAPFGVSAARFFLNGVETTTEGVDIVARYRLDAAAFGRFDFLAAANFNSTKVTKTPSLPQISAVPSQPFLFDRGNVLSLEQGTPEQKLVFSTDWTNGGWAVSAKATHYDSVLIPNNNPTLDYESGQAWIADLEGRYKFGNGLGVALGANNLFDRYPQATPASFNSPNGAIAYPNYSPFGFNGRYLYGRVSYDW